MDKAWSKEWANSTQPRKQRKYRHNAPLNVKRKFLSCNLSKALRDEYKKRSAVVKTGDRVKVVRGEHKDKMSEVERVDVEKQKIYCKDFTRKKVNGTEVKVPIEPSNVQIVELELKDPRRAEALKRK